MLELYDIYSSLPVTSVSCERGFSIMNWIETNIKNRMKIKTLHHHIIHLNGTDFGDFDIEEICDIWKTL